MVRAGSGRQGRVGKDRSHGAGALLLEPRALKGFRGRVAGVSELAWEKNDTFVFIKL